MAIIKNLEYDEDEGTPKKTSKKGSKKKSAPKKPTGGGTSKWVGVIVLIFVLGLVGLVFAYSVSKLNEVEQDGDQKAQVLEDQVKDLKKDLKTLNEKASAIEKESAANKEIVIDLFDRSREIPIDVATEGWQEHKNSELKFSLMFPANWEIVVEAPVVEKNIFEEAKKEEDSEAANEAAVVVEEAPVEEPEKKATSQVVHFQPKNASLFVKAVTFKNDYLDFTQLSLQEKYDIFKGLDLLDERNFAHGKMLYFIDVDQQNVPVPTILILTESNIYRGTFSVDDKTANVYVEYRKVFEDIVSTFSMIAPPPPPEEPKS